MKTFVIFVGAAALLVSAPARRTVTGVLTDKMCGADHSMMHVKPDSKCVRECVRAGSAYALAAGGKVYTLTNSKTANAFAGQKVRVAGTLDEKTGTIAVDSISAVK